MLREKEKTKRYIRQINYDYNCALAIKKSKHAHTLRKQASFWWLDTARGGKRGGSQVETFPESFQVWQKVLEQIIHVSIF